MIKNYAIELKSHQVYIRPKESSPYIAQVVGVREGNVHRLQGKSVRALVYNIDGLCELWDNRMWHLL